MLYNKHKRMNNSNYLVEGGLLPSKPHVDPSEMVDLRRYVPDISEYVLTDEKVIAVQESPRSSTDHEPSALRELCRLTRSKSTNEIGENGPAIAGTSLDSKDTSKELHLFEAVFGRDSLRAASDTLHIYPNLARTTLLKLASLQGLEYHEAREEEPGRIPHEIRDPKKDEIARELSRDRGWEWPYYGSVDATPEFISLLANYIQLPQVGLKFLDTKITNKNGEDQTMEHTLDEALAWMHRRMGQNDEGFVEYKRAIPDGIENQVWRDSWDAFFHADGTIANHQNGVASIDVQRLVYNALCDASELFNHIPERQPQSRFLKIQASLLRRKILETFWTEADGGYFVLAADRDNHGRLKPMQIKTSDMGHILYSPLLDGNDYEIVRRREAVIAQLFSKQMLTNAGIRTLASDQPRYRPGAYHNGNVWPWDTHLIARGLERHGYHALADELDKRVLQVVNTTKEFPEYVRGGDETDPTVTTRIVDVWSTSDDRVNRIEQPPQQVQAWTVTAALAITYANSKSKQKYKPSEFERRMLGQL